jgi:hypothetical protein
MKKLILASHVGCVFPFWFHSAVSEISFFQSRLQIFVPVARRFSALRFYVRFCSSQFYLARSVSPVPVAQRPGFVFRDLFFNCVTRDLFFSVFRFSFTSFGLPCFSSRKIFLLLLVLHAWTRYSCCALVHVPAATVQADFPCLSARWVRPWSRCRVLLAPQWLRSFLFAIFICACRSRSRPH